MALVQCRKSGGIKEISMSGMLYFSNNLQSYTDYDVSQFKEFFIQNTSATSNPQMRVIEVLLDGVLAQSITVGNSVTIDLTNATTMTLRKNNQQATATFTATLKA